MEKFFEIRENNSVKFGVITNIPDGTLSDTIESCINSETIQVIDKVIEDNNIEFELDWSTLTVEDDDGELTDMDKVRVCLQESIENMLEAEVVYSALMFMKENPDKSISDAIYAGYNEWGKYKVMKKFSFKTFCIIVISVIVIEIILWNLWH